MYVLARTRPGAELTHADLRAALDAVDPTQPLADVSPMAERVARSTARARTSVTLAAVLGAVAAGLGALGLYGVLSVGVAQRLHEFGVRLAFGASPASVRTLVLREGLGLALTGILAGSGSATAVVAFARSAMTEASVATGLGHLAGIAIVLASSAAALWLPARRAADTEPLALLRSE
jgi:ABC-type antimicrobial peptide transport system permease subunit